MIRIIDDGEDAVRELVSWCQQNDPDANEPPNLQKIQGWVDRLEGDISLLMNAYNDTIRACFLENGNLEEFNVRGAKILEYYALVLSHCVSRPQAELRSSPILLRQVSSDTIAVTASRYDDDNKRVDENDSTIRGIVIPSLFLVIESLLNVSNDWDQASLARTAALLLCFGEESMGDSVIRPNINQHELMQDFCAVPMQNVCVPIDTATTELEAPFWKDEATVVACFGCWKAVARKIDVADDDEHLIEQVCQVLGWKNVAKAVRAQFFDKKEVTTTTSVKQTRLPSYPLKLDGKQPPEPAYRKEPARMHAAMTLIKNIPPPSKPTLSHLLPVCYSLIDTSSRGKEWIAMGAAALVVLLERSNDKNEWAEFEDSLLSVLEIALQTWSGKSVTLGHVCLVGTKACNLLSHRVKERRSFALRFLVLIKFKLRNQSDEDGMLRGILVCGVIPILKQQSKNADAMELGRLGLEVLLPLLRWDFGLSGRKLQVAALIAIINLMVAAYPIMPNHGGKIVCELMACWGHAHRRLEQCKMSKDEMDLCHTTLSLSTHAGAVALLLCGERARHMLTKVSSSKYDIALAEHAARVEKAREQLQLTLQQGPD